MSSAVSCRRRTRRACLGCEGRDVWSGVRLVLSARGPVLEPLLMSGLVPRGLPTTCLPLPGSPRLLLYLVFLCSCPCVGLSVPLIFGSGCDFPLGMLFLCLSLRSFLPSRFLWSLWFFQGVRGLGEALPCLPNCGSFGLCPCSLKKAFFEASRVACFRIFMLSTMPCISSPSSVSGPWGGRGWG